MSSPFQGSKIFRHPQDVLLRGITNIHGVLKLLSFHRVGVGPVTEEHSRVIESTV